MLPKIVHGAGLVTFGYALYYQFVHLKIPPHLRGVVILEEMFKFPGHWKYITVWDMVIQFMYHAYSLANDIVGSNELDSKKRTTMQKIRDAMFASLVFPAGAFVSMTFWGLYVVDRDLVNPEILDQVIPSWLNHAGHTAPIILLFIEFYSFPKVFPKRSGAVMGNFGFSAIYLGWVTWVAHKTGVWAYPILQVLDNGSRALFMGCCASATLGLYFVGEKFQKWRWGATTDSVDENIKLKKNGKKKIQ